MNFLKFKETPGSAIHPRVSISELELRSFKLLVTLVDCETKVIEPEQFLELLYLRNQSYAEVYVENGNIVAKRTSLGTEYSTIVRG